MPNYRYFGEFTQVYPDIVIPGEGTLVAEPGDVRELDENPNPHWWAEVADPAPPVAAPSVFKPATPDEVEE